MNTDMKPIRCRLLEALEASPMTTRRIASQLGTSAATVRARLAELREIGVVNVVATQPQRGQSANVWGIAA